MGSRLSNDKYLIAHIDKSEIGLSGDPMFRYDFNKTINDMVFGLKDCMDCSVSEHKGQGNYGRLKRITYDNGIIDIFFHRKANVPYYIDTLGFMRITSTDKTDYTEHHSTLSTIEELLDEYDQTYSLRRVELALDTMDKDTGNLMYSNTVPKYFQGDVRLIGDTLYQHSPMSSRCFRSYSRECGGSSIYRTEISFNRDWLRQQEYETHNQIINNSNDIVERNLSLQVPRLDKIEKDYSTSRLSKGTGLDDYVSACKINSAMGLSLLMEGSQLPAREALRRYFKPMTLPPVVVPILAESRTLSAYC